MEYFRTLNLDREPFSNSPDPGLFYDSKQHLHTLQQLEISIRLKRGLNVITGDVGTGKTTISRQLIQKITHDPDINYSLILDPGFASSTDFLSAILKFFTGKEFSNGNDNLFKEEIKTYLFKQGVDNNKTTVLIIDEGQKLPVYCLEILRELLNYETNDQKLLQIVIFAQKEFEALVKPLENFKDRINYQTCLSPLGFQETKGFINYRLNQSIAQGCTPPKFTLGGMFAVYLQTRGYPRKIINLCHHIILSLIVEDTSVADFFFVRKCGHKVFSHAHNKIGLFPITLAVAIIIASSFLFDFPDFNKIINFNSSQVSSNKNLNRNLSLNQNNTSINAGDRSIKTNIEQKDPDSVNISFNQENSEKISEKQTKIKTVSPGNGLVPKVIKSSNIYGRLKVTQNDTLNQMLACVYGSFNDGYLKQVLSINKEIKNPNFIRAGIMVRFPAMDSTISEWDKNGYCIILGISDTFQSAYINARKLEHSLYYTRILPTWNSQEGGYNFYIIINRFFDSKKEADTYIKKVVKTDTARSKQVFSLVPKQ